MLVVSLRPPGFFKLFLSFVGLGTATLPEITQSCVVAAQSMCPNPTHPGPFACSEEVRKIFVSSCDADLRAILLAWHARNKHELLTRLHALKGALVVFGEGKAAALCEQLEGSLRSQAVAACEDALLKLDRAMRRLIDRYS